MTKNKKASARAKANNMAGRKIKGRGNYNSSFNLRGLAKRLDQTLSAIPKGSFARKGAQMGAKYGPLGALAGKGLGAGISAITGYGNYSVRKNSLSTMSTSVDMIPQFVKNEHSVRVVHREFIRDLAVPAVGTAFTNTSYTINPANKDIFPWLANMAKQYSQYKIHGMVFAFKTMSSDLALAGPLGTVIMATNYNAVDRAFVSKIEMENSEFAVSTKPSQSLIHAIECDPKYSGMDVLYVRDPGYDTTDTSDRRFYDYGKWQIATQGLPGAAGTTLGELWVSYDIELMKPILGGNTTLGTSLISNQSGIPGVGAGITQPARPMSIDFAGPLITPVNNATYNLGPSSADVGMVITGDLGIYPSVVDLSSNTIQLRRNGRYIITYVQQYGITSSKNVWLTVLNTDASPSLVTQSFGNAVGSVGADNPGDLTHAWPTASALKRTRIVFTCVVTGIQNPSDYVTLTPTSNVVAGSGLVDTLRRQVQVTWAAYGLNDQTGTYVQA